jgi:hypothetical protein
MRGDPASGRISGVVLSAGALRILSGTAGAGGGPLGSAGALVVLDGA